MQGRIHTAIQTDYSCVCNACGGFVNKNPDKEWEKKMKAEAERVAKDIYDGQLLFGQIDPILTRMVISKLSDAVNEGFDKKYTQIEYGSKHWEMLESLNRDVYHFSCAKNYQELKALTFAIYENGEKTSFAAFKQKADLINNQYNVKWLQTEYNAAVASAQMAYKWVDMDGNLEYITAGDERVRSSHAAINGVVRPKNDPFWSKWYPPNGWNCRCDVQEAHANAKVTATSNITEPKDTPAMWQVNTAKRALVFPPEHPYFNGVSEKIYTDNRNIYMSVVRYQARLWSKELPKFGKVFEVKTPVFDKLTISHQDIKTITGKPHKYAEQVYQLSYNLPSVLNNSEYIISGLDNGKHKEVDMWHYFRIKVNNEWSYINVMETKGKFHVHSIGDSFDANKVKMPQKISR